MPKLNLAESAIEKYLDHIRKDYTLWSGRSTSLDNEFTRNYREQQRVKFNNSLTYEIGSKYIKVISGGSVHSFIVNDLKGKFPLGSILKAASWRAPAKNFKRGSVLTEDFGNITWTGAV